MSEAVVNPPTAENAAAGKPQWRVLLVDDERLARKRLRSLLAAHADVEVVGEAPDLAAARACVRELQPNLVFLDVQLSPGDGFDLLPDLPAATDVIFVTAHDTFAVRAFEAEALDYLLKPVLPARLAASLERLRRNSAGAAPSAQTNPKPAALEASEHLVLRDGRTWHRLELSTVTAVQGEGTYTRLFTAKGTSLLTLRTLTQWSVLLPERGFARLSRSLIVNLARIRRCHFADRDRAEVWLDGHDRPLQLGRVASRHLRQQWHDSASEASEPS